MIVRGWRGRAEGDGRGLRDGMAEALANYAGGTINIPQRSGGDYLSLTCVDNAS